MRHLICIAIFGTACTLGNMTRAADHASVLPYIADDTLSIAFVDLERVDIPAAFAEIEKVVGFIPGLDLIDGKEHGARLQEVVDALGEAGARRLYILFRMQDGPHAGPIWIIPLQEGGDWRRVRGLLLSGDPDRDDATKGSHSEVFPNVCREEEGVVLGGMSEAHLATLERRERSAQREAFASSLEALGKATAGVVVCLDADSRRVVREVFPACPPPFETIDGRLLADGVRWMALGAMLPPKPAVQFHIQAADDASAKTLRESATLALDMARMFALAGTAVKDDRQRATLSAAQALLNQVKLDVDERHVALTVDAEAWPAAAEILAPVVARARVNAYSSTRIRKFMQLALAMHNYHDAKKSFPVGTLLDEAGAPLLSWRVAILPYIEEKNLYDKFRLDESWDSPHNLKLIDEMPDLYADPDPALRAKAGAGKTTFLVPAAPATVFPPGSSQGIKVSDVKDGTSTTAMIVEVTPDRAVTWTKPEDWQVDLKNPLRGVKRDDRDGFTAAYADGSVRSIPNSIEPDNWKKILTRDGGETVDSPY